jgi:hypothetical protein
VLRDRLGAEDVERGARDLPGVQRGLEVLVDDERPAGDVEDPHAVLALGQRLGVEPALGLRRLGQVEREEVRLGVDVVGGPGLLHAEVAVALGADEGVEGDDAHAEALDARGHELADAPEAQDAERLALELDARVLRAVPAPGDERRVRLRDVAREASSIATVCSAAVTTLDCGALTTTMPRLVASGTSTLSTPTPARPMTLRFVPLSMRSR